MHEPALVPMWVLTAPALLQAMVPVMDFLDCKPHYLWLTLERRSTKDRPPQGQIHIRFQLRSDEQYQHMPGVQNFQVRCLAELGIHQRTALAVSLKRSLPCTGLPSGYRHHDG